MRQVIVVAGVVGVLAVVGCEGETARGQTRDGKLVTKPQSPTYADDLDFDAGVVIDHESPGERFISTAVRHRVDEDGGLSPLAKSVSIVTQGSVVRLIGFAPNAGEKDRLTALAAATPGVERVDNLVVVATSSPTP